MRALIALAAAAAAAAQTLPTPPPLQPNPMEGTVDALRAFASAAGPITPSGLRRADLLDTISGIVTWFLPHQNATTGAIIDPDSHEEEEYATPCFAHSAATLVVHGSRADLLAPAAAALSCSISQLAHKACATNSCDFFAVPVMRAYDLLASLVPAATAAAWEAGLRNVTAKTWELTGQNWELTAAAGEYTRIVKKQWGGAAMNWSFWEARLGRLATVGGSAGGYWSPEGMFFDNFGAGGTVTSPMAYDAFGSSYPAVLLADGYNATGVYRDYLGATQERGVWTRAAYQSPLGEQPVGGRSNQHQFAEATLAAVAELYAGRARDAGDAAGACQLKRAAALYHSSVRRWLRADGALQITKNWFLNSSQRFGYMSYSFFSNYNLLPASWLALAHEYADDAIPECASVADVGGAAFALDSPNMRKVYGSVAGTYLELQTGADPAFDASGLNRFHYDNCASAPASARPCRLPGLLGPSQAPGISGNYGAARDAAAQLGGLATGLVWALASDAPGAPRRSLANCTLRTITAAITTVLPTNSPATGVGWSTAYVLWEQGWLLTEAYFLPPSGGKVNVTASLAAPGARALFDVMARAAAAATADAAAGAAAAAGARTRTAYFAAPADAALRAACAAGDYAAFAAAAPPHPAAPPRLRSVGVSFPAMVFDGSTNYTLRSAGAAGGGGVLLQRPQAPPAEEGALRFSVLAPAGRNLSWSWDAAVTAPSRNGLLTPVYAELAPSTDSPVLQYSLEAVPWEAAGAQ